MATKPELPADFVELLQAFVDADVRFLVIGGYAVGLHDRPRTTKDLDLLIDPQPANLRRVAAALRAFGAPGSVIDDLRVAAEDEIVWMGIPPLRIDFLQTIPGVAFAPAWNRRVTVEWQGVPVPIIARKDLIAAKRAAGRDRDLLDVANLERVGRESPRRPARRKSRKRLVRK